MRSVEPEVFLVAQPAIDYDQLAAYLREVGGEQWLERLDRGDLPDGEQSQRRGRTWPSSRARCATGPGSQG